MATKRNWNYELIAAMAAVFIGACALITSVIQTRVMLKQQSVSVLPIVQWSISINSNSVDSTGTFELHLVNKGVGPALIEQVSILYQGKQMLEDSLAKLAFNTLLDYPSGQLVSYFWTTVEGTVLMAGEDVAMFKTTRPRDGFLLAETFAKAYNDKTLDLIICFKDVYGKMWQVRQEKKIIPLKNCQL